MFERYTERARRAIFFARYEASQFGSVTIETEHLLLGLIREDKILTNRFLRNPASIESIRKEIEGRTPIRERVPTSADLPLSSESKRILAYAAEEAERLNHDHIGTEHLLLGILREENSVAAQVLWERGLRLAAIRDELARTPIPAEPPTIGHDLGFLSASMNSPALPKSGTVADAETAIRIADAVWTPLYGRTAVAAQLPFNAELRFNVWIVTGSSSPEDALFAFILQADGRILSVGRGDASRRIYE
jgi:Clp amino terminal domain, pathogenicity island component/NTF2 fold immunity protein